MRCVTVRQIQVYLTELYSHTTQKSIFPHKLPPPALICKSSYHGGSGIFMHILSVLAPLLKSRFFAIYYRCETLADGTGLLSQWRLVQGINTTTNRERRRCREHTERGNSMKKVLFDRNRRAKLAINTQTPVRGRFCHRTGVLLCFSLPQSLRIAFLL